MGLSLSICQWYPKMATSVTVQCGRNQEIQAINCAKREKTAPSSSQRKWGGKQARLQAEEVPSGEVAPMNGTTRNFDQTLTNGQKKDLKKKKKKRKRKKKRK